MRTSEERMDLIFQRTEEIQKEQQRKKQRWLEAGCVAACLVLVVSLGLVMPGLMDQAVDGSVINRFCTGQNILIDGLEAGNCSFIWPE